jgi:serine phosphatase RsbU (regulator of sigma subunit)
MAAVRLGELEWAAASRPVARDGELGDACLVKSVDHGLLIAVVDGLGHGPEAAHAARRALQTIERSTQVLPSTLIVECHRAMQSTRGVVMGVALVETSAGALSWIGVGDVRAVLCRTEPSGQSRHEALFTHNGVVGRSLPPLRPVTRVLQAGDTVIVATDGIRGSFALELRGTEPTERVATELLERYAVASDDALVLVARYRGRAA